jgi:preprotein translocase subunit SecG
MNLSKMSTTELSSYAGGATAVGASLTLTQVGVIVGIVTALLTFALNAYYTYHKNKREQRLADLEVREREAHIRLMEQQSEPKS